MSAPGPLEEEDPFVRIEQVAEQSARYRPEALVWVLRVLEATRARLGRAGHISGRELLEGNLRLARDEFGPMAFDVLGHWGIRETEDIGRIVFLMIEAGMLQKTDQDTIEDFSGAYEFQQAFVEEYRW